MLSYFESDWIKLHKSIVDQYEDMAINNFSIDPTESSADVMEIIAKIIKDKIPNLDDSQARHFVEDEYNNFKQFNVYDIIEDELKSRNPDVPDHAIRDIYNEIKSSFHKRVELEHSYFLFFVISRIIEMNNFSTSRGAYLIEIARGNIPIHSRPIQFFRRWKQIAKYNMAKDMKSG